MKAVVFAGNGMLDLQELPDPRPEGPDDVVIRVAANGICGSDLRALTTPPQMVYDEGVVIGHEFVGEVSAVGSEVTGVAVGQRVTAVPNINCQVCWYCRSGHLNLCESFVHLGSMRNGGAADYVVVPERMIVPVPDSLSDEMATLAEPLACVLNGTRAAGVHPGETVLILGAGPIGLLYQMIFKAAGAQVIVSEPGSMRRRVARVGALAEAASASASGLPSARERLDVREQLPERLYVPGLRLRDHDAVRFLELREQVEARDGVHREVLHEAGVFGDRLGRDTADGRDQGLQVVGGRLHRDFSTVFERAFSTRTSRRNRLA